MTLHSLRAARQVYGEVASPGARRVRHDVLGVAGVCTTKKDAARLLQQADLAEQSTLPPVERSTNSIDRPNSCAASDEAWQRGSRRGKPSSKLVHKRPRSNPVNHNDEDSSLDDSIQVPQPSQETPATAVSLSSLQLGPHEPAPTQSAAKGEEVSGLLHRADEAGSVPSHMSYVDARSSFLSDDSGSRTPDGDLLSMASSFTGGKSECDGSIESVNSATAYLMSGGHEGGGKRKGRRKKGRKAVADSSLVGRRKNNVHRQWPLSERELHKKMRRLTQAEQEGVARVMDVFAAQVDGKAMGERDLFNLVDRDRNDILTLSEVRLALSDRRLVMADEELNYLMTFFDSKGLGHVTFGDLHDCLRTFRKFQSPPASDGQSLTTTVASSTRPPWGPKARTRSPPDYVTATRLGKALLTPLMLFTAPPPVDGVVLKKRHRSPKKCPESTRGVGYLDITDPEIESLADYLMGIGDEEGKGAGGADRRQERDKSPYGSTEHTGKPAMDGKGTERDRDYGAATDASISSLQKQGDGKFEDERGRTEDTDSAPGGGYNIEARATRVDKTEILLRPLPDIIAALVSAAAKAPKSNLLRQGQPFDGDVRGPGAAAVPSSARRVCKALGELQRLWRQNERFLRGRGRRYQLTQGEPDGLSNDELDAAVYFFDVDDGGHMRLDDVLAVFRSVRMDRFVRCRPPTAAIPALAAIGSQLNKRGITAAEFVQKAASLTVASSSVACRTKHEGGLARANGEREAGSDTRMKRHLLYSSRNQGRPATKAQFGALLCQVMHLTAEQHDLVVDSVQENGLVWGAHLAGAVRRAKREVAHRQLEKKEQQRRKSSAPWRGVGGNETESEGMEDVVTGGGGGGASVGTASLSLKHHPASTAVTKATGAPPSLKQPRCRQSDPVTAHEFDQFDASLLVDAFAHSDVGLRSLGPENAVAVWRGIKRCERGMHANEEGRSALRDLRRLLRRRGVNPLRWFATLDDDAATASPAVAATAAVGTKKRAGADRRVAMSTIISGVRVLVATPAIVAPPGSATADTGRKVGATASYSEDSVVSDVRDLEGTESESSLELPALGEDGGVHKWDKVRLSSLAGHLDPCGEGSVTRAGFQEALRDSRGVEVLYPDASQLAAARRFEMALRKIGCLDICGLLEARTQGGRGGGDLVEYVKQMGDRARPKAAHGRDLGATKDPAARALVVREEEPQRNSDESSRLREKLARPENARALNAMRRIDEVMSKQGKRLVDEFHQADTNHSGGVDHAELKRAIENLIRPCPLLRFERKRRRERQEEAEAAAIQAESWRENFVQRMEALHRSKASHFLEAVSVELRHRRLQIRDVFREVDAAKSGGLGVDDLLKNTHRALGLKLDREEAASLVSMLDVNGDQAIQCNELEIALRSYRRYRWERARWTYRKPFHEEFPSLLSLFYRRSEQSPLSLPPNGSISSSNRESPPRVSREDVVVALVRLRGGSSGKLRGVRDNSAHARRERMLARAARKIGLCCMAAGVRTLTAFSATLAMFNFGPADDASGHEGRMRTVDVWHWLRLLSAPTEASGGGGSGAGLGTSGSAAGSSRLNVKRLLKQQQQQQQQEQQQQQQQQRGRNKGGGVASGVSTVPSGRLLDSEETSLVLDAIEYQPPLGQERDEEEEERAAAAGRFYVSVPDLWELLDKHVPGLWDREEDEKLRRIADEDKRRQDALRILQSAAAVKIQGAVRQRQARKRLEAARNRLAAAIAERDRSAAVVVQCAVRQKQARMAASRARSLRDAAAEKGEKAALVVQCAVRQSQARKRVRDARAHRAYLIEKENAALAAECLLRRRQARERAREEAARQRLADENARKLQQAAAATRIQAWERGRRGRNEARLAAAAKALADAKAKAKQEKSARRLAAAAAKQREYAAAVTIQCAVRQRQARREASLRRRKRDHARNAAARKLRAAEEDRKKRKRTAAAIKIQSVVRGYLARREAEKAAIKAKLDAALAARRAQIEAEAEAAAAAGRARGGGAGWRKKSVVGKRGTAGLAGLTCMVEDEEGGKANGGR